MQAYTEMLTVSDTDLDELRHVNNVIYIQWVNTIAKAHWIKVASQNLLDNYFWVLANHQIKYKYPAFVNDNILLNTFVESSNGITSTRIVEIFNNDTQKLLAISETTCCFMSFATRKPTRIT
ncbi:acyl-CoA thioesterase, partial [Flavobacteriaceae bacterium]|nr:acyl-CoA thioesterase [Flavobacteriaceae bacterium]